MTTKAVTDPSTQNSVVAGPDTYVTVGVPLGAGLREQNASYQPIGLLRRGHSILQLDINALNFLTRATVPTHASELVVWAQAHKIEDVDELIVVLLDRQLLVDFNPNEKSSIERIQHLRLQTQGFGLGLSPENMSSFRIGDHSGNVLLLCDEVLYSVWACSDGRSIEQVCHAVAESYALPYDTVLRHLLSNLYRFLSVGVANLDVID